MALRLGRGLFRLLAGRVCAVDWRCGRRVIEFHNSRHIQLRHGRRIVRQGNVYYRRCFSDPASARGFIEEFGGAFYKITGN
jgi:hypothetical protein